MNDINFSLQAEWWAEQCRDITDGWQANLMENADDMARIVEDLTTNAISIGNVWIPANQHEELVARTMLRRMLWALARAMAARDRCAHINRYMLEMLELGYIKVPEAVKIIKEVNISIHLSHLELQTTLSYNPGSSDIKFTFTSHS